MIDIFVPTYLSDLKQIAMLMRSLDTYLEPRAVASLNIAAIGPAESFVHVQEVGTYNLDPTPAICDLGTWVLANRMAAVNRVGASSRRPSSASRGMQPQSSIWFSTARI